MFMRAVLMVMLLMCWIFGWAFRLLNLVLSFCVEQKHLGKEDSLHSKAPLLIFILLLWFFG